MSPVPEAAPPLWRRLGAILPRSIREGVYEPACWDLWRSLAVNNSAPSPVWRTTAWLAVAGYLLAAVWYGIPRYLNEGLQGRVARWLARAGLVLAALVVFVVFGASILMYFVYAAP